jgi:hypothetical protein
MTNNITIDDTGKIQIIRRAMASLEGWTNLAESVLNGGDSAKKECHRIFEIIAEGSYNPEEWFGILTYELDRHIGEVEARRNQVKIGGPNLKTKIG